MRDETAVWLQPMIDAAVTAGVDVKPLMTQAIMPAAEADFAPDEMTAVAAMAGVEGLRHGAIDWIRFGELLREQLGWFHYPEQPPSPN